MFVTNDREDTRLPSTSPGTRPAVTVTIGRLAMTWSTVVLLSVLYCKLAAVIYEQSPVEFNEFLLVP